MKKLQQAEETAAWKPSKADVDKLVEGMKAFSPRKVNGRTQYPFELYLESRGIISFGEFGDWQVASPKEYARLNETDSLRQYIDKQEMERIFNAFPEEREKYQEWRSQQIREIRNTIRGMAKVD